MQDGERPSWIGKKYAEGQVKFPPSTESLHLQAATSFSFGDNVLASNRKDALRRLSCCWTLDPTG